MLKEFRTQRIIWDKANKRIFDPIQTSGGDQNGRRLEVQILNNGEVEDLTGTDLYLAWQTRNKTHSGLEPFDALDASEGIFELYYPTGMLAHAGALRGGLALVDSDGRLVSREFIIQVDRNIVDDEVAESSNEFTALTEALVKINDLEANYTPRLNEVTAQLAQTNTRIGNIITTPAGTVSEQEIIDARDTAVSLGENIRGIKTALIEGNLSDEMVTRSLPNGVKNEYLKDGNGYKFIHRVSVSRLYPFNFSILSTSTEDFLSVNFEWRQFPDSKVNEPNGYDFHNYAGSQVLGGSNYTNHNNFGWYINAQYISIKVPKAQLTIPDDDRAGVRKWLQDNQVIFLFPLSTPSEYAITETKNANTMELVRVAAQTDENTKEINLLKEGDGVTPPPDDPLRPYLEANRKERRINNLSGIHRFGAWNLPFGHSEYEVASQIITEKGFTFIGIQEYRGGTNQTILNHYKNETMPFHYQVENIPNLAVLSLHTLYGVEREAIPLEFYDGYQERVLTKEVIYINGKRCSVYNVHLDVNRHAMVLQVADCVDMLNADENDYKIILGDFNAYGKDTYDAFTNAGYKISNGKDGVWYETFKHGSEAALYKDNIIVSANIDIVHSEVLVYGDELSDHNMVIADLAFN